MKLEIGKWILSVTLTDDSHRRNEEAESVRRAYEAKFLSKVEAVKKVRDLFRGTGDERDSLKGSVEFIIRGPINVG